MVESLNSNLGRFRLTGDLDRNTVQSRAAGSATAMTAPSSKGAEVITLSKSAQSLPAELKSGPPIDTGAVSRIKSAVAAGKYPVNIDALTESLFQSYREMKL